MGSLSALIRAREEAGQIHGCRIARSAPTVAHLFFADDCFLDFSVTSLETHTNKQALHDYGMAIGQIINFHKSAISFSRNVNQATKVRSVWS